MLDKRKNILEKSVNDDNISYCDNSFFISYFPLVVNDKLFGRELCEYSSKRSEWECEQSVITLSDEGIENEGGGRADYLWVQYDRLVGYIFGNFLKKTVYFNVRWLQ